MQGILKWIKEREPMTFENSKILGAIGALLMVVGPLAGAYSAVLGLVGFVLLIVAFNGLADYYKERSIFNNALYGGVAFIAGIAIAVSIVIIAAVGMLSVLGIPTSSWSNPTVWQSIDWQSFTNWTALAPYVGAIIGALVILVVFAVIAAFLIRKSLKTLAQKSGVALFATTGTILFIGAILTIIVIGFILLWIALILLAVAFFRLRTEPTQYVPGKPTVIVQAPSPSAGSQAPPSAERYCPSCGTGNMWAASYCQKCGKPLPPRQ
jgi:uncharacterized membrane protein